MKRALWICLLVLALAAPARSETLTVASGAGYKKLVTELAKAYQDTSGNKPDLVFGNMGQIVTQAKGSGVVDVVIGERGFLEKAQLPFASFTDIGRGVLMVAWPKGKTLTAPTDVAKPEVKRLAMPDPEKAIYGKAGAEFLEKAGIAGAVKDKLLVVATVPQVTTYVISGEVDAGLVNRTDIMGLGDTIGGALEVDQKDYTPIVIGAGVLANAKNAAGAKAFADFLGTDAARDIVKRHGM